MTFSTWPVSPWMALTSSEISSAAPRCVGELAHFVGDDGKAAALLAGACRLDRRIQRQQVGLVGDLADQLHDAVDLRGACGELAHGTGCVAGSRAARVPRWPDTLAMALLLSSAARVESAAADSCAGQLLGQHARNECCTEPIVLGVGAQRSPNRASCRLIAPAHFGAFGLLAARARLRRATRARASASSRRCRSVGDAVRRFPSCCSTNDMIAAPRIRGRRRTAPLFF